MELDDLWNHSIKTKTINHFADSNEKLQDWRKNLADLRKRNEQKVWDQQTKT